MEEYKNVRFIIDYHRGALEYINNYTPDGWYVVIKRIDGKQENDIYWKRYNGVGDIINEQFPETERVGRFNSIALEENRIASISVGLNDTKIIECYYVGDSKRTEEDYRNNLLSIRRNIIRYEDADYLLEALENQRIIQENGEDGIRGLFAGDVIGNTIFSTKDYKNALTQIMHNEEDAEEESIRVLNNVLDRIEKRTKVGNFIILTDNEVKIINVNIGDYIGSEILKEGEDIKIRRGYGKGISVEAGDKYYSITRIKDSTSEKKLNRLNNLLKGEIKNGSSRVGYLIHRRNEVVGIFDTYIELIFIEQYIKACLCLESISVKQEIVSRMINKVEDSRKKLYEKQN